MENFEVKITADGSPTLILGEPMHNLKGALSEALYVYDQALGLALFRMGPLLPQLKVASVGLGLGYNEWMTVAHFVREKVALEFLEICSWETNETLKENFLKSVTENSSKQENRSIGLASSFVAKEFEVDDSLLRTKMKALIENQKIVLRSDVRSDLGEMSVGSAEQRKFNVIYFDAFSSYTSPDLWTDSFLKDFIERFCDSTFCVFASYASTSRLKRALEASGFELIYRRGFAGKRECTLGVRS